jgi:hypothetical protein
MQKQRTPCGHFILYVPFSPLRHRAQNTAIPRYPEALAGPMLSKYPLQESTPRGPLPRRTRPIGAVLYLERLKIFFKKTSKTSHGTSFTVGLSAMISS